MPGSVNLLLPFQTSRTAEVKSALRELANGGSTEERGAIFTRQEVVEGILDLTGYMIGEDLVSKRLLEPSAGNGDFLLAAAKRLLDSCQNRHGQLEEHLPALSNAI